MPDIQPFSMVLGVPWFYPKREVKPLPQPAVQKRAVKGTPWTEEEIKLLRRHYPHKSNEEISEKHLPGRTRKSINWMACKLGLKKTETFIYRMKRMNAIKQHKKEKQ